MNQDEIKGKWSDIKGNVKEAFNKVKDDVVKIREDVINKKNLSQTKDSFQEKVADLKPNLDKIKKDFTAGVDTAKKKTNEFKNENRA